MNINYIIAALVAVLAFVTLYTFLIPKSTRRFNPGTEKSRSSNGALNLVSIIGDDFYAALPAAFDRKRQQKSDPRIESLLRRSGNPWEVTVEEFKSFQLIAAFLGFLISLPLTFAVIAPATPIPWYLSILAITVFAFFIPRIKHMEMAQARDLQFRRELPEALELITISINGGSTFDRALKDVIPLMKDGLVKGEFVAMTRMINAGSSVHDALEAFAKRSPSDGVLTFVRSLQSALQVNAPLSEILESRAEASREEFFSLVNQKAAQLESMMFAYLTPTLLPALMLIAIAPSAHSLYQMMQ